MNTTASISSITELDSSPVDDVSPTNASSTSAAQLSAEANTADPMIERAMSLLLAGGLNFEEVERCPAECVFCDGAVRQAA